jgi:hypothetical protein
VVPTDGNLSDWGLENLAKGNYAACFGNEYFINAEGRQQKTGAFELVDVTSDRKGKNTGGFKMGIKYGVKLGSAGFRDGESKTILVSEVRAMSSANDGRGAWAWAGMGGSIFTSRTPPNANGLMNSANYDNIPVCDRTIPTGDIMKCETNRENAKVWAAARSEHPGVVNVVMVAGNIRLATDQIDEKVWKALATRNGNEQGLDLDAE